MKIVSLLLLLCCIHSTEFVWNLGLALSCDVKPDGIPTKTFKPKHYFHLKEGSVIWIKSSFVRKFYKEALPILDYPCILVISDGDESFPSSHKDGIRLIESDKIKHIFAQNCDIVHKKVSPIPIGIDFHSLAMEAKWGEPRMTPKEQETYLKTLIATLEPTHLRKKKAFVDFHLFDSIRLGPLKRYLEWGEDRQTIFNRLKPTHLIDYPETPLRRSLLWKTKGNYAFSISPHGNGLDAHRTWEDLALGCIVIVKTSPLDPLYEGLPVVIVNNWNEITEENLDKWLLQYGDAFTNPSYREKLTSAYWLHKIYSLSQTSESSPLAM